MWSPADDDVPGINDEDPLFSEPSFHQRRGLPTGWALYERLTATSTPTATPTTTDEDDE